MYFKVIKDISLMLVKLTQIAKKSGGGGDINLPTK